MVEATKRGWGQPKLLFPASPKSIQLVAGSPQLLSHPAAWPRGLYATDDNDWPSLGSVYEVKINDASSITSCTESPSHQNTPDFSAAKSDVPHSSASSKLDIATLKAVRDSKFAELDDMRIMFEKMYSTRKQDIVQLDAQIEEMENVADADIDNEIGNDVQIIDTESVPDADISSDACNKIGDDAITEYSDGF